jgi:hypothetical protein
VLLGRGVRPDIEAAWVKGKSENLTIAVIRMPIRSGTRSRGYVERSFIYAFSINKYTKSC